MARFTLVCITSNTLSHSCLPRCKFIRIPGFCCWCDCQWVCSPILTKNAVFLCGWGWQFGPRGYVWQEEYRCHRVCLCHWVLFINILVVLCWCIIVSHISVTHTRNTEFIPDMRLGTLRQCCIQSSFKLCNDWLSLLWLQNVIYYPMSAY
jgi:hypothetical protein